MLVTLFSNFLVISVLFFISLLGIILNRRNILILLLSIELMLLSINIGLLLVSSYFDDILGEIFSLFILCVAASESAIGLAIIVVFYRIRQSININTLNLLKG